MSISRRKFFRGLVGQGDNRQREEEKRIRAVESWVRTNLLPYDFALSGEQTAEVLGAAVAGVPIDADSELLTHENRRRLREIVDQKVDQWREEFLRAEEARREAMIFVTEYLSAEATPDDLQRLRGHFHIPYLTALEEEIERQTRYWLASLPNARLASCERDALRELVFSELRSWC